MGVYLSFNLLSLCAEIQAKYTETSAKNGYNIGKLYQLGVVSNRETSSVEPLFLSVAEDFIQNSRNKVSSRQGMYTMYVHVHSFACHMAHTSCTPHRHWGRWDWNSPEIGKPSTQEGKVFLLILQPPF